MNLTNLELAQASLDVFGALVCLILVIITLLNKNNNKSMRVFKWMFINTAFIMLFEACAYIYRGNTDNFSITMTRVSNFAVFALNLVLAYLFIGYVYSIIEEKEVVLSSAIKSFVFSCVVIGMGILVTNIFTGWMYGFDNDNYYHREFAWYIYTVMSLLPLLAGVVLVIKNRKVLGKATLISTVFFSVLPILAIIVQSFIYGIAITNIGLGIGGLIMEIAYMLDWSRSSMSDSDIEKSIKKSVDIILLFVMMVIIMSAAIFSCIISIRKISEDKSENDSQIIAHMVSDSIEKEFLRPISASQTMSTDSTFIELIENSSKDAYEAEENIVYYLNSIRKGMGYQGAFVVCDNSRAYYTSEGLTKFIDVDNDAHDIWYKSFIASGSKYELNVDTDEAHNHKLSVFVNYSVKNADGTIIGACGVAVDMSHLQKIITDYEEQYKIKINLIDSTGLIQIDSNINRIENDYLDNTSLQHVNAREFYYVRNANSSLLSKYIDSLGWYIVVEDLEPNKINVFEITIPSIIIFIGGLAVMGIIFGLIFFRDKKTTKALLDRRKVALTDELTGLYNRRAFEEDSNRISENQLYNNLIVVMMDVNGLKSVNDTLGHIAGDELIIGAANCMQNTFGAIGKVYRIGGDEYAAYIRCSREKVEDAMKTFDHIVASWKGTIAKELAVSKGYAICSEYNDKNLDEIKEIADKLMYADKDEYYRRTGKKRR